MSYSLNNQRSYSSILTAVLLIVITNCLSAQDSKPTLEIKDYGKWESLGFSRSFSNDGNWFAYDIRRNNDKGEVRLHNLIDNSIKVLSEGARMQFSSDSKWIGYFINPSAAAKKKSKKPLRAEFRLLKLDGTDSTTVEDVSAFGFSDDGKFLTMKHYSAKGKKSRGADLVVRNLQSGIEQNFGNVAEFAWQEEGNLLAFVIDADGKAGNGIQLFDAVNGTIRVLDSKSATYSGLKWRKESADLAVYRSEKNKSYEDSTHQVLAWRGLGSKKEPAALFGQTNQANYPANSRIVSNRSLTWSNNGESIFFAIKEWIKVPEEDTVKQAKKEYQDLSDEAPAVQVWHSKDIQVIPEQKQLADRKREDQFLSVWHITDNTFVQLENELTERIKLQTDVNVLVGYDATPYESDGMFGRGSNDVYNVDLKTGARTKILTKKNFVYDISPNGNYLVYGSNNELFVYDINSATSKNISEGTGAVFANLDDDHPTPEKRPYGFIAWEKSGDLFYVHSKYDVWQFSAKGGKSVRLTDGKADEVRHRFAYLDFEDYIDAKEPMHLSLFGYRTKKSGYGSVVPGKALKTLLWEDARVGRLSKAEEADKYAFTSETFSDSPDYFITSGDLSDATQISNTNSFQKDYAWGKSGLIDYTDANGRKLQGNLYYPANYEAGKKYPMVTYIYEMLSDGLHSYGIPSQRSYYSTGVFTQEGYFVLRPDIRFDAGDPGISSVKTMEIAVKTVVDKGIVDEKKVGLIGHSWGGYQAGFAVTQTDIFAASVAGAGLTNLTSMYGMIAWAFGGAPENAHFEVGQERMNVPPYEDVDRYIRNSSVFSVDKLNTPLLFEVGDADQNVDWRQGTDYYNAARRAGKQFVMIVYANEGHGLRQDKNRADYQHRILKWFGHYLKGEEAAPWINQGIPYEDQVKSLKNWKK
jgi:dipeptidyl aminopeptidase/acylaminoacyl peptidase